MKNLFTSIKENVASRRNSEQRISRAQARKAIAELRGLSDAQLCTLKCFNQCNGNAG